MMLCQLSAVCGIVFFFYPPLAPQFLKRLLLLLVFFLSLSLYLSLSVLSVCLSVCLPACLPACLPVCLSVCLSVYMSIRVSGDGVVSSARISSSFGKVVEIDHGYGFSTLYAHMSKIHVKRGQKVKRGEVIGEVGNTGLSAGAHLHYEVHVNGKPVDPVNYFFKDLTPEEYKLVVAQSQSVTETME